MAVHLFAIGKSDLLPSRIQMSIDNGDSRVVQMDADLIEDCFTHLEMVIFLIPLHFHKDIPLAKNQGSS